MGVRIEFNKAATAQKLANHWDGKVLPELSEEILTDCNRYCKHYEGGLIDSSQEHSRFQEGKLIWRTPYARRQYYEIRAASKIKNPGARWRWAHHAKSVHLADWQKLAQKLYNGG